MSNGAMKKSVEELLRMPAEGLKNKLSPALEEIGKYGIGRLLEEYPDFLARLLNRLKQVDAAGFFNRYPAFQKDSRTFYGKA